ncbi:MAG: hypothetical protein PHX44_01225 [Sulfurimonas sp.]|uniref:hypothetical protein n=1 Tax=Sulfurimonas sp. TaxID=2022749 RepID=UPI002636CE0A|nr:hypothetical protein [Sulfurimonas sp.]MDD2651655.1 hypothetical protein [Sulfurimonas sp.]MDD3451466.1 hypothetical protein [Sulfurimonas sp.]
MKFKKLKQELKELQDKLGSANKVIYMQMQELKELNNICELNDKFHKEEIFKLQSIVEYLERKI